jgi:hypothetical protein
MQAPDLLKTGDAEGLIVSPLSLSFIGIFRILVLNELFLVQNSKLMDAIYPENKVSLTTPHNVGQIDL